MPAEDVLDPAVVAELRRAQDAFGNPAFIRELAELFRANTPVKMDRIREALAAGDAAAVEQAAHTLRTNCAVLGAARMASACARMEEAAARTDLAAASAAFGDASERLPGVVHALLTLE